MKPKIAKDGKVIPSFLHTTQDDGRNQPITKHELKELAQNNTRFDMVTGGKANRAQRRRSKKLKR